MECAISDEPDPTASAKHDHRTPKPRIQPVGAPFTCAFHVASTDSASYSPDLRPDTEIDDEPTWHGGASRWRSSIPKSTPMRRTPRTALAQCPELARSRHR